jgi:hypothetical protein
MNQIPAIPDAAPLLYSLRSVGYTVEAAIADIVDNSITAKATEINIDFKWKENLAYISLRDNGYGMDEDSLHQAMKIGSKNPMNTRSSDDLGRFGIGLKTAAFSLCKRLTVGSKVSGTNRLYVRVWDIDNVMNSNKWELFDDSSTPAWQDALKNFEGNNQGTLVVLEKLDWFITETYNEDSSGRFWHRIADVEKHLSMVFHRFLAGENDFRILINGKKVNPWDPFLRSSLATQEFREEFFEYDSKSVRAHVFILPHHSKLTIKEYEEAGGPYGWLEQQGFYVYRNKRLIVPGTWFKMLRKNEPSQLARIQLDLSSDMDFEWNIDVKKSMATSPSMLRDSIRRIALVAQEASRRVYYYRGAIINQQIKVEDNDAIWEQTSIRGRTFFRINRSHPLLKSVYSELQNDKVKRLNTFIGLVEGFAPMNISLTGPLSGESKQDNDLIESAAKFYHDLIDVGYNSNESLRKVLQISVYEGFAEAIKKNLDL